jgi:hypothetical protein
MERVTAGFGTNSHHRWIRYDCMVNCARCGNDVDEVHHVTPDLISAELVDSIDHGEEDVAGEDGLNVCAECLDELGGD